MSERDYNYEISNLINNDDVKVRVYFNTSIQLSVFNGQFVKILSYNENTGILVVQSNKKMIYCNINNVTIVVDVLNDVKPTSKQNLLNKRIIGSKSIENDEDSIESEETDESEDSVNDKDSEDSEDSEETGDVIEEKHKKKKKKKNKQV